MRSLLLLTLLCGCARSPSPAPAHSPPSSAALSRGGHPTPTQLQLRNGVLNVNPQLQLTWETSNETRVLDNDVVPELTVTSNQQHCIYPRRTTTGTELRAVSLVAPSPPRTLTTQQSADRPRISTDDALLVFWGSEATIATVGLYTLRWQEAGHSPVRRNNLLGITAASPQFIPPPIRHDSVQFLTANTLRYEGPEGSITLQLPEDSQ